MTALPLRTAHVGVLAQVALALTLAANPSPAAADDQIFIEATALRPPVLVTAVGHRVTFVNGSGRIAHVEFLGEARGHRVFQVPGEIWAVFHHPGRHEYLVHLSGRMEADLRGAVEVAERPGGPLDAPVCNGLTVMGECLER